MRAKLRHSVRRAAAFVVRCVAALGIASATADASQMTLVTLDPGHFHAALFQKEMLPGIAEEAYVYAPLGVDLIAHLNRVAQFNLRPENPTHWRLRVYGGADYWERLLSERPGQIVVMSGRNRGKVDRMAACVRHGLHVLADKPWIIEPEDLSRLQAALDAAEVQGVAAGDAMTQRFEISALLQRALVNDADIFGSLITGSLDDPAVYLESLHYLLKEVAGVPSLRPGWFFDIREQGEGLTDVGTHLADMVPWILFPDQAIAYGREIQVLRGTRWPTLLALEQFQRVTGERGFPESIKPALKAGRLEYFANNTVHYTLRGVHIQLVVKWEFVAAPGAKDTECAVFRGSKARIEARQSKAEDFRREVYVVPNREQDLTAQMDALENRVSKLQKDWPGIAVEAQAGRFRLVIPDRYRVGHEEHFALVARRFLDYVKNPKSLPFWEKPNLLAKYYVTTRGVELARQDLKPPSLKPTTKPNENANR